MCYQCYHPYTRSYNVNITFEKRRLKSLFSYLKPYKTVIRQLN